MVARCVTGCSRLLCWCSEQESAVENQHKKSHLCILPHHPGGASLTPTRLLDVVGQGRHAVFTRQRKAQSM
jgi:hypothetical protein